MPKKHTNHSSKQQPKQPSHTNLKTGTISINSRGVGFVRVEGQPEDIVIHKECLGTALHRDTVELTLLPKRKGERLSGEIVKVIERNKTQFVGTLVKTDGAWLLDPDDRRMYVNILLSTTTTKHLKAGYKALAEITHWTDCKKQPEGKLISVIGKKGEHETEMRSVVLEAGFEYHFPPGVETEAKKIQKEKEHILQEAIKTRKDMRDTTTFTIDPYDAKDFDDALSVKKLENGAFEIGVHIADVSAYVHEDDAIDKEAQERATSIYLVDRTIPMLPEVLSNDVCSLNPHEDKLAFSAIFTFDASHKVTDQWFGETVINSDRRFNYEEAQEILDSGTGDLIEELTIVQDVARTLREKKFKDGAMAFETEEIKFKLDEKGVPIEVFRKTRQETNMLIEDLMLLANRSVAKYVSDICKKTPDAPCVFVYRIHDKPKPEKIIELATYLKALGYELHHRDGEVTTTDLNEVIKKIEGTGMQDMIETTAIRSMAKAIYSLKNIGHFSLAFKHYCHFTSPIRRYPDMMVHRILKRVLSGKGTPGKKYTRYEKLSKQSTEQEIAAAEAERESVKYKQVEFLKDRIGEVFTGKVTGVTEFGIFIEEQESKAEGLVRIRDLRDDYYQLDDHGYKLVGVDTKKSFGLCDKVDVKLIAVDLEQKTIDWRLV